MDDPVKKQKLDVNELRRLIMEEEARQKGESIEDSPSSSKRKSQKHNSKRSNKKVERFIEEMELESGDRRLPNYIIYYNFLVWWDENRLGGKKPGNIEFFRTFNKHFDQTRTGKQRYYMLNARLDESKEAYEKGKKEYQKRFKKRNKKRKRKISGTEQKV